MGESIELGYTFWRERARLAGKNDGSMEPFKCLIEPFFRPPLNSLGAKNVAYMDESIELGYNFWRERARLGGKNHGSMEPFKCSIKPFLSTRLNSLGAKNVARLREKQS